MLCDTQCYVHHFRRMARASCCAVIMMLIMMVLATPAARGQAVTDSVRSLGIPAVSKADSTDTEESAAAAQQESHDRLIARNEQSLSLELSGLIVDETQTKMGRDFYEQFYAMWRVPEGAGDFLITITERPMPRRGTQIQVFVNDYEILKSFLQPRAEVIEQTALSAAQRAYGFVQNYQSIMQQLQGDDMAGSGIF